jgi:CRISPR/Cas system CSM-associated protein Csm3 (group 7 of RAMP superfamily)
MRCRLTAITPIFIPMTQIGGALQFITARYSGGDLPVIPGSSLKGVIRSVAEAVSESCIGVSGELFHKEGIDAVYRGALSPAFVTCKEPAALCPACRLFGMVSRKSHFRSKVAFSDGRTEPGKFKMGTPIILKPLMEPKPHHTAFYRPKGKIAGRKFYFHHCGSPKTAGQATEFTKTVTPLEGGVDEKGNPRTVFEFEVSFASLTEEEYSILLFALVLTEEMRHKVGGAKPLGLGTVRIEITELRLMNPQQRYKGLSTLCTASSSTVLTGNALQDHIKKFIRPIVVSESNSLCDLEAIWQYPPASDNAGEPEDYRYPGQDWFAENSDTPIEDTP